MPFKRSSKLLPPEIWGDIFALVVVGGGKEVTKWAFSYLTVCKSLKVRSSLFMVIAESIILFFQNAALPALYSAVTFTSIDELGQFYQCLSMADQKWDSIHWTPYSAPGRWVLELDLSNLAFEGAKQALHLDSLLTQLFPLTPFLRCLSIVPSFVMSRRATRGYCQFTYIGRFFIFSTTTDTPR